MNMYCICNEIVCNGAYDLIRIKVNPIDVLHASDSIGNYQLKRKIGKQNLVLAFYSTSMKEIAHL